MDHPPKSPSITIEMASIEDVFSIKGMVVAAYSKYIERIGKRPAPMDEDYDELVRSRDLCVLRADGEVTGLIHLWRDKDSIMINNVVVDPSHQGRGYGRLLMNYAENMAFTQGVAAITLYTNIHMHENITLYSKLGFTETGRRMEDGFDRVFFRKNLV
ncbi:acyl-CoA N-acyltransferase [Xylogone sp. PMI_703]|nr:acyl-CoA N-acyltransferase [Xylogone sp. PMI_703]